MSITITMPALLFPAITLLLLAYTNRFLAVATLIRNLHRRHVDNPGHHLLAGQIDNLRSRTQLIKHMQVMAVSSFVFCVLSMFFVFSSLMEFASYSFGASLLLLLVSLLFSLREVMISNRALELELSDMEPQ